MKYRPRGQVTGFGRTVKSVSKTRQFVSQAFCSTFSIRKWAVHLQSFSITSSANPSSIPIVPADLG